MNVFSCCCENMQLEGLTRPHRTGVTSSNYCFLLQRLHLLPPSQEVKTQWINVILMETSPQQLETLTRVQQPFYFRLPPQRGPATQKAGCSLNLKLQHGSSQSSKFKSVHSVIVLYNCLFCQPVELSVSTICC